MPLFNRYGGRELSVMACQFAEDQPLHVLRPWLFLEILDGRGRPAVPGEVRRLVWTSTVCRGTPFLRYDVEDLGTFRDFDSNESGITAIHELPGRVGGMLELPGGRKISNLYWNHFVKDIHEVAQFQVILRKDGSLQILLRGDGFSQERDGVVRDCSPISWVIPGLISNGYSNIPRTQGGEIAAGVSRSLNRIVWGCSLRSGRCFSLGIDSQVFL